MSVLRKSVQVRLMLFPAMVIVTTHIESVHDFSKT